PPFARVVDEAVSGHGQAQRLAGLALLWRQAGRPGVAHRVEAVETGAHVEARIGSALGLWLRTGAVGSCGIEWFRLGRRQPHQRQVYGAAAGMTGSLGDVALRQQLRLGEARVEAARGL